MSQTNAYPPGPMLFEPEAAATATAVPVADMPMELDPAEVVAVLPPDPVPPVSADLVPAFPTLAMPVGANWPLRLFAGGTAIAVVSAIAFDAAGLLGRAFALGWLPGWLLSGVMAAAAAGLATMLAGEWRGLMRLRRLDQLRQKATALDGAAGDARTLVAALLHHYRARPDLAGGAAALRDLLPDCHDDIQVLTLTERHLLAGLDEHAYALTAAAARDAAIMTALLPTALLDMTAALWRNLRLMRAIAALYGSWPGYWGGLGLLRRLLASLAATGAAEGLHHAASDVLGGTAAAAVSASLGKGLLNGMLTARIGLAAMQVCRPLPFAPAARPSLARVRASLFDLARDKPAGSER